MDTRSKTRQEKRENIIGVAKASQSLQVAGEVVPNNAHSFEAAYQSSHKAQEAQLCDNQTRSLSSQKSRNSSATVLAKRLAIEAEHARQLADQERKVAELELRAKLAALNAEESRHSSRYSNDSRRISELININNKFNFRSAEPDQELPNLPNNYEKENECDLPEMSSVIGVTVSGPKGSVNTYALLDDGSTGTFIDADVANSIGAVGPEETLHIDCVAGLSCQSTVQANIRMFHTGLRTLCAENIQVAENHILRKSQMDDFAAEIRDVFNNKTLSKKSKLCTLSPVLDDIGLMRLCGRIAAVKEVNYSVKNPVILHGKHAAVRLLVEKYHKRTGHANTEMVLNELRQLYWILSLRNTIRSVAHRCQFCRIRRTTTMRPPMGDLPKARLAHHHRPFTFSGLDYFGPVSVAVGRRRKKRWIALYTCLVTRAVHIEVVHSLSSDAALMSLRRFIARRGTPSEIYSDNGTSFVGVKSQLRQLYSTSIEEFAAGEKISWRFIPPAAPFMGGAWERLVRSIKTALNVTMRERTPTDEVLVTLLLEAEALVNSRPLTHVSTEYSCPEALTPFHFILGSSSGKAIPASLTDKDLCSRTSWRKAVRLADHFWARWVVEYLPTLQPRRETQKTYHRNVKLGDIVIIADGNLPRGTWPKGKVTSLYPGQDGVVRVVDVTTAAGVLRRPVRKLILLEV